MYIRGGPKNSRNCKKNYLKYSYKFETLVPFKVLPLRLDAAIPANRWRPLTAFPLKILDNVSSIGSGAGIAASSRRGSTSKGVKISNLYKYFNIFFNNSGNFWVPPLKLYISIKYSTAKVSFSESQGLKDNTTSATERISDFVSNIKQCNATLRSKIFIMVFNSSNV